MCDAPSNAGGGVRVPINHRLGRERRAGGERRTRVARCRPAARRHSWGWQRTTEHTRTQAVEGRSRAAVRHRPMVAAARSPGAARRMPEVAHTARHLPPQCANADR
eukprot:7387455-Prymnesium_polylepis.1